MSIPLQRYAWLLFLGSHLPSRASIGEADFRRYDWSVLLHATFQRTQSEYLSLYKDEQRAVRLLKVRTLTGLFDLFYSIEILVGENFLPKFTPSWYFTNHPTDDPVVGDFFTVIKREHLTPFFLEQCIQGVEVNRDVASLIAHFVMGDRSILVDLHDIYFEPTIRYADRMSIYLNNLSFEHCIWDCYTQMSGFLGASFHGCLLLSLGYNPNEKIKQFPMDSFYSSLENSLFLEDLSLGEEEGLFDRLATSPYEGVYIGRASTRTQITQDRLDLLPTHIFRGASLRGLNLSGLTFRGFDFTGTDFTDCRLIGSCFTDRAILDARGILLFMQETKGEGALFDRADLTGTKFISADLQLASFLDIVYGREEPPSFETSTLDGAYFDQRTSTDLLVRGAITVAQQRVIALRSLLPQAHPAEDQGVPPLDPREGEGGQLPAHDPPAPPLVAHDGGGRGVPAEERGGGEPLVVVALLSMNLLLFVLYMKRKKDRHRSGERLDDDLIEEVESQ